MPSTNLHRGRNTGGMLLALLLVACSIIVDNKLKTKPLEADSVAGQCATDASCDNQDPCDGTETCDVLSRACQAGAALADETECQIPDGGLGKCMRSHCIPVDCGDGVVDATKEDCDTALDTTCPSDCVYECQSTVKPKQGCSSDLGLVCSAHRCVQPSPSQCAGVVAPNKCTKIVFNSATNTCTYQPVDGAGNPIADSTIQAWIAQYPKYSCSVTDVRNNARVQSGITTYYPDPYCQDVGPSTSPTSFPSFDYDCNGVSDSQYVGKVNCAGECKAGWNLKSNGTLPDPSCGQSDEYYECLPPAIKLGPTPTSGCSPGPVQKKTQTCR